MSTRLVQVTILGMCIVICGCSRAGAERYVPAPQVAEGALTAVLEAWRSGDDSRTINSFQVPIQVADSGRQPGQTLQNFRILGEVAEDGGRIFQVELQLQSPDEVKKTQFVVVGIDPLWVIRRDDYDMLTHWEHATPPASPAAESDASPNSG